MSSKTIEKSRRSVELTKAQIQFLKNQIKSHPTVTDAGIALGISKDVLSRTLAFGSCSEKTYNKLFPSIDSSEDFERKGNFKGAA